MILNITKHHFEEVIKKGYNLDVIYLLTLIKEKIDIKDLCANSVRINNLYLTLVRKDLVNEENGLTLSGQNLLDFIETINEEPLVKKEVESSSFLQWWDIFPGTDTFTHKDKSFQGTRSLKTGKPRCKTLFDKIVNSGKHTAEEIIEATKFDILQRKENSVKRKSNQITFLQNSQTYLFNDVYEPFIELIKKGEHISLAPKKGLDIDI